MPLHVIQCDPGGEYLLPWANAKLRQWHQEMEHSGQASIFKTVQVSDGSMIYASSLRAGDVFIDKLRITGGLKYVFLADINPTIVAVGANVVPFVIFSPTGTRTISWSWPDGSSQFIASGTVDVVTVSVPGGSHIVVTFDNYPNEDFSGGGGYSLRSGIDTLSNTVPYDGLTHDAAWFSFSDQRDTIVAANQAKLTSDPTDPLVTYLFDTYHPMIDFVQTYKNGETMTLVELDYTYAPEVYTDDGPEAHHVSITQGTVRTDGAVYDTETGVITAVTLTRKRTYKYNAATAAWIGGTVSAITDKTFATDTFFGNVAVVSKNPVTGAGASHAQLETTYKTQMAALAALDPAEAPLTINKLLAAVSRVV